MKVPFLIKRRQSWYLQKKIPQDIQHHYSKLQWMESLGTTDKGEATRRLTFRLAEIQQEIDEKRMPVDLLADYRATARWVRLEQQKGEWKGEHEPSEILDMALDKLGEMSEDNYTELRQLHDLALYPEKQLLITIINEYIENKRGTVRPSTLDEKQIRLNKFSMWAGKGIAVGDIGKIEARKYISEVIDNLKKRNGDKLAAKTKIGHITILKAFFEWCDLRGLVDGNPFRQTEAIITKGKKLVKTKVRGWKDNEVVSILEALTAKKKDPQLTALTLMAMYTGARANELAELRADDVTDWSFRIQGETKNDNSLRAVPVHPIIREMVERLKETSTDGYLVSGLKRAGKDNKRFPNAGKRFGYLKRALGYMGRSTVFHSFRHTTVTLLHGAGESQERIAGVVGHTEDLNFTLNTYSDGLSNDEATKVINKIDYGKSVTKLVTELATKISN